jgi:adenine-specific DNA-methyltransferase
MEKWESEGRLMIPDDKTKRIRRKIFVDEYKGQPVPNLWSDIFVINSQASEGLNYPTQKPESLLRRIIEMTTEQGDLVLDCFMGSGTTQSVATSLGRRFLGADVNLGAVQTTTKRLINLADELRLKLLDPSHPLFTGFEVHNVNQYDIFRNPVQAKDLLLEALEVQKLEMSTVFDGEKDGRMIKIMPVNRIATRADLNELIAGFDYKAWERRQGENPNRPVEKVTLVCMGHEPNLRAELELAARPYKIDVQVVDILRDKANLEFKRDSEAKVAITSGELVVERFYPMNLLQKLSMQKEAVEDWRELVESILIDWNYDGAVLQPAVVDIPGKTDMVAGRYKVPADAGTIRVKITDLLSESWEGSVTNG